MKCIFKGKDGSLGYRTGRLYDLSISITKTYPIVITSPSYCPYSTIEAFCDNWKVIWD